MNTTRLLLLLVLGFSALTRTSFGFNIQEVRFSQTNAVNPSTHLSLAVTIDTPSSSAFLYEATEIRIDSDEVVVIIYPSGGPLGAIDTMTVDVPLGTFSVGEYRVLVLLKPAFHVDWGRKFIVTALSVYPELELQPQDTGYLLRWQDPRREYLLEQCGDFSTLSSWSQVDAEPSYTGSHSLLRIDSTQPAHFFRLRRRD